MPHVRGRPKPPKRHTAKQVSEYRAIFRQLEVTLQSYADMLKQSGWRVRSFSWNYAKVFRTNGDRSHLNITVFGDTGQVSIDE